MRPGHFRHQRRLLAASAILALCALAVGEGPRSLFYRTDNFYSPDHTVVAVVRDYVSYDDDTPLPFLSVFKVEEGRKQFLYEYDLKGARSGVRSLLLSNDGSHAAALCSTYNIADNNPVLLLCDPKGVTRSFTLDELMPSAGIEDSWKKSWNAGQVKFFLQDGGRTLFCLRQFIDGQFAIWLCLDIATGQAVTVDDELSQRLDDAGRDSARAILEGRAVESDLRFFQLGAMMFLQDMHLEDDRRLLVAEMFNAPCTTDATAGWKDHETVADRGPHWISSSRSRRFAESLLCEWDGQPNDLWRSVITPSLSFGEVHIRVDLPVAMTEKQQLGLVYLMPETVSPADWTHASAKRVVPLSPGMIDQRLREKLGDLLNGSASAILYQTPPGKYWIRFVYLETAEDAAVSRNRNRGWDILPECIPSEDNPGLFVSPPSAVFEVKAGETVELPLIQCNQTPVAGDESAETETTQP